jgi:metallophosphoesterase (TIGR00282 family)
MNILFIGDIVARAGRDLVRRLVPPLVTKHRIDIVVANAENAAGGAGLTREIATELFHAGVHVLTSGNHIWNKREVLEFIDLEPRLIRPANYPSGTPGQGSYVWRNDAGVAVGVINVMGRVFMAPLDDPFVSVQQHITRVREAGAKIIVVDFHAEATSEKLAMGWHLDGSVSAVLGTHTHVQTADDRVLPGGTAYLTDVGMTGPHDGVIGMERSGAVARFLTGLPSRFAPATGDPRLNGVIVEADPASGLARGIQRVSVAPQDPDA